MADQADQEERFQPTNGAFGGWLGIGLAVVIAGYGIAVPSAQYAPWAFAACAVIAAAAWTLMLRPRVWVAGNRLVLRQPFSDQSLPLAAVGGVSAGRVLEVRAFGKRYVSAAIGRSAREAVKDRLQPADAVTKRSYADFVERRIEEYVESARRRVGDADPGEVRRQWAWPEIVGTAASVLALVVTLAL